MQAYIYQAALWCEDCGKEVQQRLFAAYERAGDCPPRHELEDSDAFPQGPYADGGGESDSPHHCDACGLFLENPLTSEGRQDVIMRLQEFLDHGHGNKEVLDQWAEFYDLRPYSYKDLRFEFSIDFSWRYDPYGHTIGAWFDVASELCWRGADIPDDWHYSSGASSDPREPESGFFHPCQVASTADLLEFGALLHKLYDRCKREGKDY